MSIVNKEDMFTVPRSVLEACLYFTGLCAVYSNKKNIEYVEFCSDPFQAMVLFQEYEDSLMKYAMKMEIEDELPSVFYEIKELLGYDHE